MNSEELLGPRCSGISGIGRREGIGVGDLCGVEGGVGQGELLQKMAIPSLSNSMLSRRGWEKEISGAQMAWRFQDILKTY